MEDPAHAWLEMRDGSRFPLGGTCTIGRDPKNSLVITGDKVSRRHALIHCQSGSEYWVVDLGSRNGTFRNGRPIKQPTKLENGDQIDTGSVSFRLCAVPASAEKRSALPDAALAETVATQRLSNVWLLIVDVVDFTSLAQSLPAEEITRTLGAWLLKCSDLVENSGGCVDKYVGDGFLAYWERSGILPRRMAGVLEALTRLQAENGLRFRWILHNADLALGLSRFRNESLVGKEINFTYRMEKVAGALRLPRLLSKSAADSLGTAISARAVGLHDLKGFDARFEFFTI